MVQAGFALNSLSTLKVVYSVRLLVILSSPLKALFVMF